jgi:putative membrane protein insertion efficiency factor
LSVRQVQETPGGPTAPSEPAIHPAPSFVARGAIVLVQVFRVIRFALFPVKTCRFVPTCTEYTIEALRMHGIVKGAPLALQRVSRCHPFHPGGIDPVPPVLH